MAAGTPEGEAPTAAKGAEVSDPTASRANLDVLQKEMETQSAQKATTGAVPAAPSGKAQMPGAAQIAGKKKAEASKTSSYAMKARAKNPVKTPEKPEKPLPEVNDLALVTAENEAAREAPESTALS